MGILQIGKTLLSITYGKLLLQLPENFYGHNDSFDMCLVYTHTLQHLILDRELLSQCLAAMFKVSNGNTRKRTEICLKLTIKKSEQSQ